VETPGGDFCRGFFYAGTTLEIRKQETGDRKQETGDRKQGIVLKLSTINRGSNQGSPRPLPGESDNSVALWVLN